MGNNCLVTDQQNAAIQLNLTIKEYSKEIQKGKNKPDQIITKKLKVSQDFLLIHKDSYVSFIKNNNQLQTIRHSMKLSKKNNITGILDFKFRINSILVGERLFKSLNKRAFTQTQLWFVMKQKRKIEKDDIFKIGSTRFRILRINNEPIVNTKRKIFTFTQEKQKVCKICYEGQFNYKNNPLIAPCLCTGSIKHVHLQCLKNQIGKSVAIKSTKHGHQIQRSKLICSICKYNYWHLFKDEIINLSDIIKLRKANYIQFEAFEQFNPSNSYIGIQYFEQNEQIDIGRSSSSQIKIESDHVSRKHARIFMNEQNSNEVYLEDLDSMIGSYFLIQKSFQLTQFTQQIQIKVGQQYIKFQKGIKTLSPEQKMREMNKKSSTKLNVGQLIEQNIETIIKYSNQKNYQKNRGQQNLSENKNIKAI